MKRKTDTERQREKTNFWINLGFILFLIGVVITRIGITLYNQATANKTEIIK